MKADVTCTQVRELLAYDPATGVIRWLAKPNRRIALGAPAGSLNSHGYLMIRVNGIRYAAHRIAWLLAHGTWPDAEVDHINGNRSDNRLENLRSCSSAENRQNLRGPHRDSKSGLLGVSWNRRLGKWVAQIAVAGQARHLGLFADAGDAHQAYLAAKREMHPFGTL